LIIQTVNVADVQSALGVQLTQWPGVIDMTELVIKHGEKPPDSETECPWIGVYCVEHNLPMRTLGMGSGFRYQRMSFWLVCKEASPNSGNECAAKLETLVQLALSAVLSDCSLGGTVDTIDDMRVRYPEWGKVAGVYLQTAVIQFTAQTTVKAGG
jgi:hypothetical protein